MTSLEFVKGYSRNTKNKKSRAKLSILYFLYYSKDRSSRGLTIHTRTNLTFWSWKIFDRILTTKYFNKENRRKKLNHSTNDYSFLRCSAVLILKVIIYIIKLSPFFSEYLRNDDTFPFWKLRSLSLFCHFFRTVQCR